MGRGPNEGERGHNTSAVQSESATTTQRRTVRQWVFLYGNRRWIALFLSALTFCFLLGVGAIWEFEMERLVVETRAVQTLFNTLLGGVILFLETLARIDRLYAQRRGTSTPPITMLDG